MDEVWTAVEKFAGNTFLKIAQSAGHSDCGHKQWRPTWVDSQKQTSYYKALAKRTRKSTQVWTCIQLAFRLATHLHRLTSTCDDFGQAQIWTQVDARFYRLTTQRKSTQVICCYKNALTNYMREIYGFLRFASRLANPFGHPSQVLVLHALRGLESVWPGLKAERGLRVLPLEIFD